MKSYFFSFALLLLLLSCKTPTDAQYILRKEYEAVTFTDQIEAVAVNDGRNRLYVVEQAGKILWLPQDQRDVAKPNLFLDITSKVASGGERGLLGLAFHPDFKSNGYFYVNYTAGNPLQTRISRFTLDANNPDKVTPGSEQVLLAFNQPYPNHNGGKIAFGPDGFLYIGVGDGGSGGDPQNHGQNRETLLGNILRIDVNAATGGRRYGIPADNPFAKSTEGFREEIYAFGLRNPWKFSFDRQTGTLWAGDVGQNEIEEIDIIKKGGNYGWRIMEGTACYKAANCATDNLILPVYEYKQGGGTGRSITGGVVYRGSQLPELQGKYVYGDYASGNIWALELNQDGSVAGNTLLLNAGFAISGFGEDRDGEILILNHGNNKNIFKLGNTIKN